MSLAVSRLSVLFLVLLPSCGQPDYNEHRDSVRSQLRDPNSAEFRDERIRVLWTEEGTRVHVYCAEVNSNNAYGGKVGFTPVRKIISVQTRHRDRYLPPDGTTYIEEKGVGANHYLDCIRPDTQRNDAALFKGILQFGPFDAAAQAEADKIEPVLSNDDAPPI